VTKAWAIIDLCILADKTVAETSTWLASGKTYEQIAQIFLAEADSCSFWWPESEVERQSRIVTRLRDPN
jgi:hypothetical protein